MLKVKRKACLSPHVQIWPLQIESEYGGGLVHQTTKTDQKYRLCLTSIYSVRACQKQTVAAGVKA